MLLNLSGATRRKRGSRRGKFESAIVFESRALPLFLAGRYRAFRGVARSVRIICSLYLRVQGVAKALMHGRGVVCFLVGNEAYKGVIKGI